MRFPLYTDPPNGQLSESRLHPEAHPSSGKTFPVLDRTKKKEKENYTFLDDGSPASRPCCPQTRTEDMLKRHEFHESTTPFLFHYSRFLLSDLSLLCRNEHQRCHQCSLHDTTCGRTERLARIFYERFHKEGGLFLGREMRNYPQDHDNRNALTFCFILRNPPSRKRSPVMRIHSNCSKSSSQSLGFLRSHRSTPRVCISCCFEASFAFSAPHLDLARVASPPLPPKRRS